MARRSPPCSSTRDSHSCSATCGTPGARERPRGRHRRRAPGRAGRRPDHQDLSRALSSINLDGCNRGHRGARRARDRPFRVHLDLQQLRIAHSDDLATEESELSPVSLYAEQKVEIERRILAAAAAGIDYAPTVLRIATAYGLSRADALRPDRLRVHLHACRRRGAHRLRRRYLAAVLPRLRHRQGGDDGLRRARGSGRRRGFQRRPLRRELHEADDRRRRSGAIGGTARSGSTRAVGIPATTGSTSRRSASSSVTSPTTASR